MKKLLVLPGHSPRNIAWGEGCTNTFQVLFTDVVVQHYDHWKIPDGKISFTGEIEKIRFIVDNKKDEGGDWYIVAKSIGSLLALEATSLQVIKPVKCIFFGMPLDFADKDLFKNSWAPLANFAVPSLVFHNDEDPTASYEFTKNKLNEVACGLTFVTLTGNNHDYLDFPDYLPTIKKFLGI